MSWPPYPEYKNTHLLWLDRVPTDWTIEKFRYCFSESSEKNGGCPVGSMLSVSGYRGVEIKEYDDDNRRRTNDELEDYRVVRVGQLAVNTMWLNHAGLGVSEFEGHISPAYRSYWINSGFNRKYVHHLLRSSAYVDGYTALLTGIRPNSLQMSRGDLMEFPVLCPPYEQQEAIADFLDRETAKIDALIGKQDQLVAALQEQRSTTTDLVLDSHGFSAPRSLADLESATPPEGWQIIRLGTVLRQLTNGFVGPTRDILVDQGVPYIQSTHIKQGRIDFNRRPFYVRREWHDERPRIHLREGDVLIVQTGDIGKVAVVPPGFGEASCHALQIARVKPEKITGKYLGVFLGSRLGYHYLCSLATGALHPHLEAGIRRVPIVVPPLPIQAIIVRQVNEQTAKIDALIAKATEVIETLREYRAALITDAVTGKIDVRAAV